jgi:hypothetical protein
MAAWNEIIHINSLLSIEEGGPREKAALRLLRPMTPFRWPGLVELVPIVSQCQASIGFLPSFTLPSDA